MNIQRRLEEARARVDYWRRVRGQNVGFQGAPGEGKPVVGNASLKRDLSKTARFRKGSPSATYRRKKAAAASQAEDDALDFSGIASKGQKPSPASSLNATKQRAEYTRRKQRADEFRRKGLETKKAAATAKVRASDRSYRDELKSAVDNEKREAIKFHRLVKAEKNARTPEERLKAQKARQRQATKLEDARRKTQDIKNRPDPMAKERKIAAKKTTDLDLEASKAARARQKTLSDNIKRQKAAKAEAAAQAKAQKAAEAKAARAAKREELKTPEGQLKHAKSMLEPGAKRNITNLSKVYNRGEVRQDLQVLKHHQTTLKDARRDYRDAVKGGYPSKMKAKMISSAERRIQKAQKEIDAQNAKIDAKVKSYVKSRSGEAQGNVKMNLDGQISALKTQAARARAFATTKGDKAAVAKMDAQVSKLQSKARKQALAKAKSDAKSAKAKVAKAKDQGLDPEYKADLEARIKGRGQSTQDAVTTMVDHRWSQPAKRAYAADTFAMISTARGDAPMDRLTLRRLGDLEYRAGSNYLTPGQRAKLSTQIKDIRSGKVARKSPYRGKMSQAEREAAADKLIASPEWQKKVVMNLTGVPSKAMIKKAGFSDAGAEKIIRKGIEMRSYDRNTGFERAIMTSISKYEQNFDVGLPVTRTGRLNRTQQQAQVKARAAIRDLSKAKAGLTPAMLDNPKGHRDYKAAVKKAKELDQQITKLRSQLSDY